MQTVWIIGGGAFGLRAAEALGGADGRAEILIVEKDPARCRELDSLGYRALCADGVDFLAARLERPARGLWIVACVPLHLAYEWVKTRITGGRRIISLPMPAEIARRLPNPFPGSEGQLYASNAASICPPDCSEAGRLCTATGRRQAAEHACLHPADPCRRRQNPGDPKPAAGAGGGRPAVAGPLRCPSPD